MRAFGTCSSYHAFIQCANMVDMRIQTAEPFVACCGSSYLLLLFCCWAEHVLRQEISIGCKVKSESWKGLEQSQDDVRHAEDRSSLGLRHWFLLCASLGSARLCSKLTPRPKTHGGTDNQILATFLSKRRQTAQLKGSHYHIAVNAEQ